ncbi:hypothetical protein M758_6G016800 [Ceratodon purpureus]|nr:hypothetical protein M758_6G016800 [Ceratodon purpureus]
MWESNESVFNVIKPPPEKRRRSPARAPDNAPNPMTVRHLLWKMKNNLKIREAATFGRPPGSSTRRPRRFLKKHSKEPRLSDPHRIIRNGGGSVSDRCMSKKDPLPDLEKNPPKYGLKSDTDYITANAVMVIRAKPNRAHWPKKEKPPMTDPGFGRLPAYLTKRKKELAQKASKNSPKNQGECQHPGTRRLDGDEKQTIINGLKIKWAVLNAEYQRLPFIADTDAQKIRRNRYEDELENLQRDISLLSRKVVLVSEKSPSKFKPPLL